METRPCGKPRSPMCTGIPGSGSTWPFGTDLFTAHSSLALNLCPSHVRDSTESVVSPVRSPHPLTQLEADVLEQFECVHRCSPDKNIKTRSLLRSELAHWQRDSFLTALLAAWEPLSLLCGHCAASHQRRHGFSAFSWKRAKY